MPICKNCHARISKFDKDICPVCGEKDPLSGVTSDTIEVTHGFDGSNPEFKKQAPRKKTTTFLYFSTLGWTGLGFFYLRRKMFGIIWLILNLLIIGGVGYLLFLTPVKAFGFIISLLISYFVNVCVGLVYRFVSNLKDGVGELIL